MVGYQHLNYGEWIFQPDTEEAFEFLVCAIDGPRFPHQPSGQARVAGPVTKASRHDNSHRTTEKSIRPRKTQTQTGLRAFQLV